MYQYYYVPTNTFSKTITLIITRTSIFHLIRHNQPNEGRVATPTLHTITITTITRLASSYHTQPSDRREDGYTTQHNTTQHNIDY